MVERPALNEPNAGQQTQRASGRNGFAVRRVLARLSVFWERAWPAFWPTVGVAGSFIALSLFDLLPQLPAWLHALMLTLFALALAYGSWRAVRAIRVPSDSEAVRRLETDSGLEHRPLSTVADRPAVGVVDPETDALWRLHIARAVAASRHIRLRLPRPNLAARDPFALRAAVVVVLVVAAFAAGPDAGTRLARALSPNLHGLVAQHTAGLELWITPPDYTNLPPRLLASADAAAINAGADDAPIMVPVGSVLLAQVSESKRTPELRIGDIETELDPVTDGAWRAEASLDREGAQTVSVTRGSSRLGAWDIVVVPDMPPTISFAAPPAPGSGNSLQLSFEGSDDHGIASVNGTISWPGGTDPAGLGPVEIALPQPRPSPQKGGAESVHDLTAHPWAGLEVDIQLFATDGRGQTGRTDRLSVLLPERTFNHPVAQEIVAQRRVLALSPDSREEVARSLHNIAIRPGRFDNDTVVFLALMSARSRLVHARDPESTRSLLPLLWDTALRLEDGALSLTQRELASLREQLREALENGASDEEIRELMEELRAALDRFLEALAQNLSQALEGIVLSQLPEAGQEMDLLDRDTLQQMLDQIEQMARLGDQNAAEQLMEQLSQMLQSLQDAPNALQQQQAVNPAFELLRDLQSVVRRQQELHDETFRRNRNGETMSEEETTMSRADQNEVRRQLGDLMRRLGEMMNQIPENLGNAEDAMGQAEEQLEAGDLPGALESQARALDELQQGGQQMALQMFRQRGQGPGQQPGLVQPGEEGFDPLGRPLDEEGEFADGFQTDGRDGIGDGEKALRALEIQNELRRRARDTGRPAIERNYLERLLRRF